MIRVLDILEDYLYQMHMPFERLDGRIRGNDRQAAIDRFSKPGTFQTRARSLRIRFMVKKMKGTVRGERSF